MVKTDNIILVLNKEFTERKDKECSLEFQSVKYNDIMEDIVILNYGAVSNVTYKRSCYELARGIRKIDINYHKDGNNRQISSNNIHHSIDLWNFINNLPVYIIDNIDSIEILSTTKYGNNIKKLKFIYEDLLNYYFDTPDYYKQIIKNAINNEH